MTTTTTQGLGQTLGGDDQPLDKNVSIAQACQDGTIPVIGTQNDAEEKKMEDLKESATTLSPIPLCHSSSFSSHYSSSFSSYHSSPISSS